MENLNLFSKKKVELGEVVTNVKIVSENEIKEILSVRAEAFATNAQSSADGIFVDGKVKTSVCFVNANGEVLMLNAESDFADKKQVGFSLENLSAIESVKVLSYSHLNNEISISVEIKTAVCGTYSYLSEIDFGSDDLVFKTKEKECNKLVNFVHDNFMISSEFADENATEIIDVNSTLFLEETVATVDKIIVSGKIFAEILEKIETGVKTKREVVEFRQEIDAQGVLPGDSAEANLVIVSTLPNAEKTETGIAGTLAFNLSVNAYAYRQEMITLVEDLFSTKNVLNTAYKFAETTEYISCENFEKTIETEVDVLDLFAFDELNDVFCTNYVVDTVTFDSGKAQIQGNLKFNVYFLLENEIHSKNIEVPVCFEEEIGELEDLTLEQVVVNNFEFKLRSGKFLDISAKMQIKFAKNRKNYEKYVNSYEISSERENADSGIKVYVAKTGENSFDVAKAIGVRPEIVEKQNEEREVFDAGEKVYVYSPINLF